jgi:adenylylsulfate kinase
MSWALWVTGPPASGKSTIAREVAEALRARGHPVVVLELDAMRRVVTPAPAYTDSEREVVYRGLVWVAALLTGCGVPVVIDATAHRRAWRELARACIPSFAEAQLSCPLPVRRERERQRAPGNAPVGIYAAAERPGATVPGVNVEWEPTPDPEVSVDTATGDVATAVEHVLPVALGLADRAPARPPAPPARWAIWITGRPGSGKTTLAARVADALARRGVAARILDLAELRAFVHAPDSVAGNELAHRLLAFAAKTLTDAGVPVILDATGARRAWRQLARELIGRHFAEVQLECPPDICGDRERAVRWNLTLCVESPRPAMRHPGGPELVLDYEAALSPELTIRTDVEDAWLAAEKIFRLAEQLHRHALAAPRVA